jgi:hypothetical protein
MLTYLHTYTHMCTYRTCIRIYIDTYKRAYLYLHACIHTCMHTYIYAYIHAYIYKCVHTCVYIHFYLYLTYIHITYVHTCMHIHTYKHIYVCMYTTEFTKLIQLYMYPTICARMHVYIITEVKEDICIYIYIYTYSYIYIMEEELDAETLKRGGVYTSCVLYALRRRCSLRKRISSFVVDSTYAERVRIVILLNVKGNH